jgi:hypothetical protein
VCVPQAILEKILSTIACNQLVNSDAAAEWFRARGGGGKWPTPDEQSPIQQHLLGPVGRSGPCVYLIRILIGGSFYTGSSSQPLGFWRRLRVHNGGGNKTSTRTVDDTWIAVAVLCCLRSISESELLKLEFLAKCSAGSTIKSHVDRLEYLSPKVNGIVLKLPENHYVNVIEVDRVRKRHERERNRSSTS